MKNNRKILAITISLVAVGFATSAAWIVNAQLSNNKVNTIISDTGSGDTFYDPPEILLLSDNNLTYQYTSEISSDTIATYVNQYTDVRTSYWYANDKNETYIYDTIGRLTGYMSAPDFQEYATVSLSEQNCVDLAEAFASETETNLGYFDDVSYTAYDGGAILEYIKNKDTIYESMMRFRFDTSGTLTSIASLFTDIEELSETDRQLLSAEVESYIAASSYAGLEKTLQSEQCYVLNNILYYQASITFTDTDNTKFNEIYIAGKPLA